MNALIISLLTITLFVPLPASSQPRNFHDFAGAAKGAVLGFAKKPVYFDIKKGMEELSFLYDQKKVRIIVSLDHCKDVSRLIDRFRKERPRADIDHVCRKIRRGSSKKNHKRNIRLFKELADMIRAEENFYIHCRYGAHRAVTALTGAWIDRAGVSFEEGFDRAGGNKRHFRSKAHYELLNHARKYARRPKNTP